ncbi:MAG TPA: NUDIX domain-containing protein [Candidatus Egerieicola faecale]|jgi:hypothetical protein|uniref:Bis(5'-nucleosyl)-tetraphosphatase [asymmetrical] n=1 Tax=Candidatus Egerieicola faecale TaxID=2840774 RepID=A0A9D1ISQ3_9FIRM|nr:NUDIX domain-containing protein [Candidatus Egerieicola faecale]
MEQEKSCGAVIFRKHHGNTELLLIKHTNGGHWSFPKGHVEPGETEAQTALREVREETGLEVQIDTSFREVVSYSPRKDTIKNVVYFLAWVKSKEIRPQPEEVSQVKWVEISLAPKWLNYDNDRQLVSRVKAIIKKCY